MDGVAPPTPQQGVLALEDWEQPPRRQPGRASAPVLEIDGFEGPLDWLLDLARTQRIDLARLSIVALVEAFDAALTVALGSADLRPTLLGRWGDWLVMAADLALLRSRMMVPADAAEAQDAHGEAERLRQRLLGRAETSHAADWLEGRGQLGRDVFVRGQADEAGVVRTGRIGDITALLRACLVAIRLPEASALYRVPGPPEGRGRSSVRSVSRHRRLGF
jgi:segregation and condensation protein A